MKMSIKIYDTYKGMIALGIGREVEYKGVPLSKIVYNLSERFPTKTKEKKELFGYGYTIQKRIKINDPGWHNLRVYYCFKRSDCKLGFNIVQNRYELVIKAKEGILQKTLFSICYGDDDVGYGKLYSKEEIRLDNSLATLVKALFDKAIKHEN